MRCVRACESVGVLVCCMYGCMRMCVHAWACAEPFLGDMWPKRSRSATSSSVKVWAQVQPRRTARPQRRRAGMCRCVWSSYSRESEWRGGPSEPGQTLLEKSSLGGHCRRDGWQVTSSLVRAFAGTLGAWAGIFARFVCVCCLAVWACVGACGALTTSVQRAHVCV